MNPVRWLWNAGQACEFCSETKVRENVLKEIYGESENDPDATGEIAGGKLRSQQQNGSRDARLPIEHCSRRSEEERRFCAARPRAAGARRPQSPHWAEPAVRRIDQDPGQKGRQVPCRESGEGFDRSAEEAQGLSRPSHPEMTNPAG